LFPKYGIAFLLLLCCDHHELDNVYFNAYAVYSFPPTCAQRQLYGYCPTWALDWDHRKDKLLQEIVQCGADVICLQEVETSQFHAYFAPELRANGYEGVFYPKTRVCPCAPCFVVLTVCRACDSNQHRAVHKG
jgi:mRNA deadenylase 3'-5' endonuclease subunit Ccr4